MAAQDEVERLDLLCVRLARVEACQRPQYLGAAYGDLPDRHAIGNRQRLRCEAQRSAHDPKPRVRDPAAIVTGWIAGIEQMPEPVLGPAIFLVIDALAQQFGFAVTIAQEERVTLGGNRQAPELPLLFRLRIEVVAFDLEDRLFDCFAIVGIEPIEQRNDFVDLCPGQRADRLASVVALIRRHPGTAQGRRADSRRSPWSRCLPSRTCRRDR